MPHLHDGLIQAHLDGELDLAQLDEVKRHLALCAMCRASADELRQLGAELRAAVRQLDDAEPAMWRGVAPVRPVLTVVRGTERRTRPRTWLKSAPRERATSTRALSMWKWAAAALVLITGAASAAMVAAPRLLGLRSQSAERVGSTPTVSSPTLRPAGAVAVVPQRDSMFVLLSEIGAGSRLIVMLSDRADVLVSVRADSTHAAPARFRTGDARVVVRLAHAPSVVTVELPSRLRSTHVLADGRVLARVSDGRIVQPDGAAAGIPMELSR